MSTRKKATGPDRAAGRRRPGARPVRRRGRLGAAGRRGRGCPAPNTSSSGSGSGPARSTAACEHQEEGHGARPGSGPALARCSPGSRAWPVGRRGRGRPAPSTPSSGSGPALARCSPSSRTWPAGRRGWGSGCPGSGTSCNGSGRAFRGWCRSKLPSVTGNQRSRLQTSFHPLTAITNDNVALS